MFLLAPDGLPVYQFRARYHATFRTSIQQVRADQVSEEHSIQKYMIVRDVTTTIFYKVNRPKLMNPDHGIQLLTEIACIGNQETGDRKLVDVALRDSTNSALLVNDQGAVYEAKWDDGVSLNM